MSHDIDLTDITLSGQPVTVHSVNFTYNYSPALHAAGFKWEQCDGKTAAEIEPMVVAVICELVLNRDEYEPKIAGGGTWGNWDDLIIKLGNLAQACHVHHKATFDRC